MLIFNAFAVSNSKSQIRQFHVDSNDDYEAKIKILEPSDTALIAEYPAENNIVLNIAVKYWLGYGLYYPDIKEIDLSLLSSRIPKIILLTLNHPDTDVFSKFGQVVYDETEYRECVAQLVFSPIFFEND